MYFISFIKDLKELLVQAISENEFAIWGLYSKLNLYIEQNFQFINLNQNIFNSETHKEFSHITSLKQNKKIFSLIKKTYKKMAGLYADNFSKGKKGKQVFYDLFAEIESRLFFLQQESNFDTKMYIPLEQKYHLDKSNFLYAFSSFNLIASLFNIHLNQNLDHPEKIVFEKVETYWNFSLVKDQKLLDYLTYIAGSYCFQYLKLKEADFKSIPLNINNSYNFSAELMLCLITLMTTLTMSSIILNQIEKQTGEINVNQKNQ